MLRSYQIRAASMLYRALADVVSSKLATAARPISRTCVASSLCEPLEARRLLSVNVTTYHYNNSETGANTNETALTLSNVNSSSFGKIASMNVSGEVYTQPLLMTGVQMGGTLGTHDVVLVATETDLVYAFDAYGNNPAQGYLWKTSLLQTGETPVPEGDYGTTDIIPWLGVTGTPVIDPTSNTMYLVGLFKESNATYTQRLYALNIVNGSNAVSPVTIAATYSGSTFNNSTYSNPGGVVTFSAFRENQRPALTLTNGEVYIGWASHGDQNPWHGWLMGYNAATLHQDYVYCTTADGEQGGIWMSGGAVAVDASGDLFFTTGNGTFDSYSNTTADADYSMALEEVSANLTPEAYFAPYNANSLSNADLDYGCANVILLTNQGSSYPNEVLSAGKWGVIFLNNAASLGGFNTNGTGPNSDLGEAPLAGASTTTSNVHNTMVYWNGSVYLGGDALTLQAFAVANGTLGATPSSQTSQVFGNPGSEDGQGVGLTVSSNGTSNGIIWALDNSGFLTSPSVLYAYNASNLAQTPLWTSGTAANGRDTAGVGIKFQDPVVANGHVYIAGDGSVTIYGLLPASTGTPTLVTAAAASPANVTGNSTTLSVLASDPGTDLSPNYTWTATALPTGAASPTFSINGTNNANTVTATFTSAGAYTFTATIEDPNSGLTITSNVNVTVAASLTSIALTPTSAIVANGATQQFTATAYDQYGGIISSQPTFTYSVVAGGAGGTITSSGLYTAPASGTGFDAITATTGSFSAQANVTTGLTPATNQVNLSTFDTKVGIISDGTTLPSNGGIDGDGDAVSANIVGTNITWNNSSFAIPAPTAGNGTANVLSGAGQTLALSQNRYQTLKILGFHVNGNQASSSADAMTLTYTDSTTLVTSQKYSDWFTSQGYNGENKVLTMGYRDLYTGGQGTGPFYVYGYSFTLNNAKTVSSLKLPTDANFIILAIDLVGLNVTTPAAATPSPVTGTTTVLTAKGTQPTGDAAPTYTWYTTALPAGATAPTFSSNGTTTSNVSTATFHQAGNYTFTVVITDPTTMLSGTSSVSVTVNQTLTSVVELPATVTLLDGATQQFTGSANDQFGQTLATQPTFTYSVRSGGVGGTVNSSTGLYTAPSGGAGTDVVYATTGAFNATATVTVQSAAPVITTPAAANPSPVTGTTTNLSVLATDVGSDPKPIYTWAATTIPSGATAPTFSVNGTNASNATVATFYQAGSYTFTVGAMDPANGLTTNSSVTVVVNQTLTSFTISPAGPVSLYNGQTQQFTAAALDQFGKNLTSQPSFSWSLGSGIGSVSSTGLYTAPTSGIGSAVVKATFGGISAQANVSVNQPAWLGAGSVAVFNSATGILTVTGATSIIADPGNAEPIIQANGSAAVITINPGAALQIHLGGLSLLNSASATVTSLGAARTATNHRVVVLGLPGATTAPQLTIDSASKLNLLDNDFVDHNGNFATINALLKSGFNAGGIMWSGTGINSSNAAAGMLTTLGEGQPTVAGTFDSESVSTSDVEIRYTYYGDANLDGHVDGSDYSLIDNGYLQQLTGFNNGDFNYDGVIDGSDYTLVDNAFNVQGVSLDATIAAPAVQAAASAKPHASLNINQMRNIAEINDFLPRSTLALTDLVVNNGKPIAFANGASLFASQSADASDSFLKHRLRKAENSSGQAFSDIEISLHSN